MAGARRQLNGAAGDLPCKRGQALIWAANLLHGGIVQNDHALTRWLQVTHYYFSDCIYYTPAFSDEPLGQLDLRRIANIATGEIEPNLYVGEEVLPSDGRTTKRIWPWQKRRLEANGTRVSTRPDAPEGWR